MNKNRYRQLNEWIPQTGTVVISQVWPGRRARPWDKQGNDRR